MTTIITRSALVFHGHNPPPNVASVVIELGVRRTITWDDVMRERRERQASILARRRDVGGDEWAATKLWVAYFGQNLMGGWQAFLDSRNYHVWIDRDGKLYKDRLMAIFQAPKHLFHQWNEWETWKEWFAKTFRRRTQCRKPLGVAYLWKRGHDIRSLRSEANA